MAVRDKNLGGGAPTASAARRGGAPGPTGPELALRVSGPGRVGSSGGVRAECVGTGGPGGSPHAAKRGGRPKQYTSTLKVPLTVGQRDRVEVAARAWRCSRAEAVRRLIDGHPVPAPVEVVAVDPEQYEHLCREVAGVRTALNRAGGNIYRLARDCSSGWDVATAEKVDALRADLDGGLGDLRTLAEHVQQVAPW